jgi:Bacterial translation initiation factor IF-2 associated region
MKSENSHGEQGAPTQAERSAGLQAPSVLVPTFHLTRPAPSGVVRQSFSHGRSKVVVIEKVKRRLLGGENPKNALSEPAAKNPPHGGATAAPSAPSSGDTGPAIGRAGSKTTRPVSTIPLPVARAGC